MLIRCSNCQEVKDENGFHKNKSSHTGYNGHCKECRSKNKKAKTAAKNASKLPKTSKVCNICYTEKSLNEFYKATSYNGYDYACKECVKAIRKERTKTLANTEKHKPETKWCYSCEQIKPANAFYNNKTKPSGLADECKLCAKQRNKDYAERTNYDRKRALKRYNMTMDEYNVLFTAQNNTCAICKTLPSTKPLAVDHDHTTGKIRGLLCSNCNTALGLLYENPSIVANLLNYILCALAIQAQ